MKSTDMAFVLRTSEGNVMFQSTDTGDAVYKCSINISLERAAPFQRCSPLSFFILSLLLDYMKPLPYKSVCVTMEMIMYSNNAIIGPYCLNYR